LVSGRRKVPWARSISCRRAAHNSPRRRPSISMSGKYARQR